MQTSEGIRWGVADHVGRIVLARVERSNAITPPAAHALVRAIDEVLAQRPRVVVLQSEARVFCAGGDIDAFAAAGPALGALVDDVLEPMHPAIHRLATAPLPVVAAVNGPIGGAGIGIALCADFVLASESMKLRTGYAALGLSPDVGASYFLARRVGAVRAQQWLMLSETIDARRCLASGVVDAVYPDAELAGHVQALVGRLAASAGASLAAIKQLCGGWGERDLRSHLALEHQWLLACARSAAAQEGVRAFVERRAPRFPADV